MEQKNGSGPLAGRVARLREALERDPNNAWEYCNLGEALEKLGQSGQAIEALQRALYLAPDFVRAHRGLGEIYMGMGCSAQAAGSLRTALELEEKARALAQNRRRAAQRLINPASSGCFNQF
jgi:tetratricopeptide (TPR) repeat protein